MAQERSQSRDHVADKEHFREDQGEAQGWVNDKDVEKKTAGDIHKLLQLWKRQQNLD